MLEGLSIDFSSPVPIYAQISAHVQECVENGSIRRGAVLPPIRSLAEYLGINQNTVLQAYDRLQNAGMVMKRRGMGTVVTPGAAKPAVRRPERIEKLRRGLDDLIKKAVSRGSGSDEILEVLGARLGELARDMTHGATES